MIMDSRFGNISRSKRVIDGTRKGVQCTKKCHLTSWYVWALVWWSSGSEKVSFYRANFVMSFYHFLLQI